jgi:two-component system cell cycle sensor histidine kinase/response regulator CckA
MPEGGRLSVTTGVRADDAAAGVVIAVEDSGAGIDPQILPHIFEPFFTTKSVGRGTGLGLAMVYGIVKQHRGTIDVASEVGRGTRFEVRLPFADRARASSGRLRLPVAPSRSTASASILVVEDDDVVLALVTSVLRREGFDVITAPGPVAAIELAARHPGRLDLVLTDVMMPRMNGVQMFEAVARERPQTRVVYMSGYGQDALQGGEGEVTLLQKPFTVASLVATVRGALTPVTSGP